MVLDFVLICVHTKKMKTKRSRDYPKTDLLKLRLHPDEKARIVKLAKEKDISMSEYVRQLVEKDLKGRKTA